MGGRLGVGGVCWWLGVSAASPLAAAAAPPPGVLIRWLLARLGVVGLPSSLGLGAVTLDMPRGQAVETDGWLVARVRMGGACGDVVAAVGAPVVADPAALLVGVVLGSGVPAVGDGRLPLELVDAHRLGRGLRGGHGDGVLPPGGRLLVGAGGVPGRTGRARGGRGVLRLMYLLLGHAVEA